MSVVYYYCLWNNVFIHNCNAKCLWCYTIFMVTPLTVTPQKTGKYFQDKRKIISNKYRLIVVFFSWIKCLHSWRCPWCYFCHRWWYLLSMASCKRAIFCSVYYCLWNNVFIHNCNAKCLWCYTIFMVTPLTLTPLCTIQM
jgi:hypothetical protein